MPDPVLDPTDPPLTPDEKLWQHLTAELVCADEIEKLNGHLDYAAAEYASVKSELAWADDQYDKTLKDLRNALAHERAKAQAQIEAAREKVAAVNKTFTEHAELRNQQVAGYQRDVITLRKKQTALEHELETTKKMLRRDEQAAVLAQLQKELKQAQDANENLRKSVESLVNETRTTQKEKNQALDRVNAVQHEFDNYKHQVAHGDAKFTQAQIEAAVAAAKTEAREWQERALTCGWVDPAEVSVKLKSLRDKIVADAAAAGESLTESEIDSRVDISSRFQNLEY